MLEPGSRHGDLVVEGLIGQGSHAAIFQVSTQNGVVAALKVLLNPQPLARRRLEEEARALEALHHPNVVGVYRILEVEGLPAILLELVEGPTLGAWLDARRTPTVDEALELFKGIARGVQAAHAQGMVHRDLNPGNVLLSSSAAKEIVPKITDFGTALALDRDRMTGAGPLGTPAYVAPEQWQDARNADHRSDLFSLGCILYELVTGERAFPGDMNRAYKCASSGEYVPPTTVRPDLPEYIEEVIVRLLQPDPEDRFQSAADVLELLFLDDVPAVDLDGDSDEARQWSVSSMSTAGANLARHLAPEVDTDTTVTHPLALETEPERRPPTPEVPAARTPPPWVVGAAVMLLLIAILGVTLVVL